MAYTNFNDCAPYVSYQISAKPFLPDIVISRSVCSILPEQYHINIDPPFLDPIVIEVESETQGKFVEGIRLHCFCGDMDFPSLGVYDKSPG